MSDPGERPPVAERDERVRVLHGERVVDPYAWMRDHDDPRLLPLLEAERAWYERSMRPSTANRARLAGELRRRLPAVRAQCPWWQGGDRYQLVYRQEAQYPSLLRWTSSSPEAADGGPDQAQVLLDVEAEAGEADYAELGLVEPSDDGRLLAYSLDLVGDEVYELRFRDLVTGRDLPDRIPRSYYGGAWTADGAAFYYAVHDRTYRPFEVWRHRIGTPVGEDELVHTEPDRRFELEPRRTRSGDHVLISAVSRSTRQELVLDAHDPRAVVRPLRPRRDGVEDLVDHHRNGEVDQWLLVTNDGAPEFRLLHAPVAPRSGRAHDDSAPEEWTELVASRPGQRLESVTAFAGGVVLAWRREGRPVLEFLEPATGSCRELVVPGPDRGAARTVRLGPNHDYDSPGVTAESTSLIDPPTWWSVPFGTGEAIEVHRTQAPGHDAERYVTQRITLPARDGVLIPVTLAWSRQALPEGPNAGAPGLLWGYGAYESCDWPEFTDALPVWLDQGVVHALVHLRGGGEGGRTWWEQGRLRRKPTTFTDHLDVADALVDGGWMAPDRLATRGLSAGGLLQGAVLTLRPDRWAAVVAEVPFVDCVNSMLDPDLPLTVTEWEEWGDPRDPADYAVMRGYTPYENLPSPPWPRLLVTGSLHDPRVLVHEPAKWVAALRAIAPPDAVLLFRAETGAGSHTGPSGRFAAMDYEAEVMTFVLEALGCSASDAQSAGVVQRGQ